MMVLGSQDRFTCLFSNNPNSFVAALKASSEGNMWFTSGLGNVRLVSLAISSLGDLYHFFDIHLLCG